MKADEIRKLGERWFDNSRMNPTSSLISDTADRTAQTAILVEIAAQLADFNEQLRRGAICLQCHIE